MTARVGACLAALAFALGAAASRAQAGDPDRVWRTLESEHFIVNYPAPLDDLAHRVAVVAERAHRTLAPALGHAPAQKTLIKVTDDTDGANGFANVVPRNSISINATAPAGYSSLGDHDDWLYGLVAHEYSHILHLDTMSGLPRIYNAIFGKTWAPNQALPRWIIEGLATYEESKRSSGGRTRSSEFASFLRGPILAGAPLRLDQINGAPRLFPRGNIAYLHGSSFLQYIFDRFGDDALARMSHEHGAYPIPFALNRQLLRAVGKGFPELYDAWTAHLTDTSSLEAMAVQRRGAPVARALTFTGEANYRPHYSADGAWLVWFTSDGYALSTLREMPVGGDQRQARDLVRLEALGSFDLLADGSVVYEQGRTYREQVQYQDLFLWKRATRQSVQLTRGRRARDPAVSPDERWVAYSQNLTSTSVLAVMALSPDAEPEIVWRGGRFDQAYQPAWSPDGAHLAFSAWRHGGYRDILLVDRATKQVTEVTRDRAMDGAPTFSPDGRWLVFESDRTGISNLFAYDLRDGQLWQITDELGNVYEATISRDGARLAYRVSGVAGYDLRELPFAPNSWRPATPYLDDRPAPVEIEDDEVAVTAPRPYRALETLAPRAWTYQALAAPAGSYTVIRTDGSDAAGLHAYNLTAGLILPRGELNLAGSYAYTGWRPAVRVSGARTIAERVGYRINGVGLPYREEILSASASLAVPAQRRPEASWFLSFDYAVDWSRLVETPDLTPVPDDITPRAPVAGHVQSGLGVRLIYTDVKGTLHGVGPQDGMDLSLGTRVDLPELGATYRALTVSYAARWFHQLPLGPAPSVALRLAGAIRAGDLVRDGAFTLGGLPRQDLTAAVLDSTRASTTGVLHGYPARTVSGTQFHLLSAELRQLGWNVERGLSTLPIYAQRLHVAALGDLAAAWDDELTSRAVRAALGGAVRLDLIFGYFVAGTLELGYARGLTEEGVHDTWLLLTGTL
ncbi:MAG: DPP IV N-terminal domain-containing protein [Kofleriaceae bacterium]